MGVRKAVNKALGPKVIAGGPRMYENPRKVVSDRELEGRRRANNWPKRVP